MTVASVLSMINNNPDLAMRVIDVEIRSNNKIVASGNFHDDVIHDMGKCDIESFRYYDNSDLLIPRPDSLYIRLAEYELG